MSPTDSCRFSRFLTQASRILAASIILASFCITPGFGQGSSWFQEQRSPQLSDTKIVRQPEPDAASKQKSTELIREVYGKELDGQTSKLILSSKMIELGIATTNDTSGRFVLFQTAKALAVSAGDLNTALRAVTITASYYEIDAFAADKELLIDFGHIAKTSAQQQEVLSMGLELVDAAIRGQRIDIAQNVLDGLQPIINRSSNLPEFQQFRVRSETLQKLNEIAEQEVAVMDSLKTDPNNPDANLVAGRFFCAKKHDWKTGLPLLAKGSDAPLKKAAEMDIAAQNNIGAAIDVAESWRAVRAGIPIGMESASAERASYWYTAAIPNLVGLQKALAQKRLEELRTGSSRPISPIEPVAIPRFAGITPSANAPKRVVFICDASGSMMSVFWRVKEELQKGINELQPTQAFNLIFFADVDITTLSKTNLLAATADNKHSAIELANKMSASGTTNPIPAVRMAFQQKPDVIYLLTDGFDQIQSFDSIIQEFRKLNTPKSTKVNAILIRSRVDPELERVLNVICSENGGTLKILERERI